MKSTCRTLVVLTLGIALVVATGAVRFFAMERYVTAQTREDVYYLPSPDVLPLLSFGYREALADLLWTRALVYIGEEMRAGATAGHVFDYADALLSLDPDFRAVYHWVATAGLYRPMGVTPDDIDRTLEIMRRGLERFPEDGELAWSLGATLAFELPPLLDDPEARDAARSEGADFLAIATRLGAAPRWAVLSNATILARVGRNEAALRHLEEMYEMISDPGVRLEMEAAIASLRNRAHAEAFVESHHAEERRRAEELPYFSADLYFLVGPRPVVDWRNAYREGFAREAFHDEPYVHEAQPPQQR
jgi:hypothetical protein